MANKMLEKLEAFMESDAGKKSMDDWFAKEEKRQEIREYQIIRVKKMFSDKKSFDSLMERMLIKNGDDWQSKCYDNGKMPYPTKILSVIHDIADRDGVDHEGIDEFTTDWPCDICSYMGWQFAVTHGQGSVLSVYRSGELMLRF